MNDKERPEGDSISQKNISKAEKTKRPVDPESGFASLMDSLRVLSQAKRVAKYFPNWLRGAVLAFGAMGLLVKCAAAPTVGILEDAARIEAVATKNPWASFIFFLLCAVAAFAWIVEWSLKLRSRSRARKADRGELDQLKERVESSVSDRKLEKPDKKRIKVDVAIAAPSGGQEESGNSSPNRIIGVISGKGGVGKSMISLGLLECLSRDENTLLVDLDLHNRGLTSLLYPVLAKQAERLDYSLNLFSSFLGAEENPGWDPTQRVWMDKVLKSYHEYSEGQDQEQSVDQTLADSVHELFLRFAGTQPYANMRKLRLFGMDAAPKANVILKDPLAASRASFLPSIPRGKSFLKQTDVRTANEDAAFLFLRALAQRADDRNGINHMIIDCHGAHDQITVGVIRAATDLVIVCTPDMGSIEGTRELIEFSKQLGSERPDKTAGSHNLRSLLIVNRCIKNDPNAEAIQKAWSGDLSSDVICFPKDDSVERISRGYVFGALASQPDFWAHIETVIDKLELG